MLFLPGANDGLVDWFQYHGRKSLLKERFYLIYELNDHTIICSCMQALVQNAYWIKAAQTPFNCVRISLSHSF